MSGKESENAEQSTQEIIIYFYPQEPAYKGMLWGKEVWQENPSFPAIFFCYIFPIREAIFDMEYQYC